MNKTITKKIMIWIMVIFLTVNLVSALGIRPAKTIINSDDVKDLNSEFWVVNGEGREFTTDIYLEGEMAEYVTLKTKTLTFREDDEAKPIEFEVHLPEVVPPGESIAVIVVEEKLRGNDPKVISSKVVLKHKIRINGPYPDKYIEAKLNFHEMNDEIEFVSEVTNLGKEDIDKIQTVFYVNDKQQEKHSLETVEESLDRTENKLLRAKIDKDVFELGEFEVSAVTKYDDQQIEVLKMLMVGKPEVEITYFDKYFIAHKVNEYTLELLNNWNKRLENVFVDVLVMKDNQQIDEFRTRSIDIEGLLREKVQDYYDARERDEGSYRFDMEVNFWNSIKMEQKKQSFDVEMLTEDGYKKSDALTGGAVSNGELGSNTSLWVIIVMLFSIIAGYVGYRYKNKDKYRGDGIFK
ncbi:MAG: hypothetical protein Q8Q01_01210 [archaeon]|nr:hypothetical protein [archaeon]